MDLRQRVEAIWENGGRPRNGADAALAAGLRAMSIGYGIGVEFRSLGYSTGLLPSRSVDVPVISIGNLTVGGTGKTPIVMEAVRMLQQAGRRPAVVSRGYRRSGSDGVLVVSNGQNAIASAEQGGDEPVMMARNLPGVPVVVGSRRYEAALAAQDRCGADVIVLDDGFQHRALARDCDIVLWDATRPHDLLSLFPRGPMREEIWALRRAHALVFTRCNIGLPTKKILSRIKRFAPHLAVFYCDLLIEELLPLGNTASPLQPEGLRGRKVGAFCGIGNPQSFWKLLENSGAEVVYRHAFPDHHRPTSSEIAACMSGAKVKGAECLLMTEKDFVKLPRERPQELPTYAVRTRIDWKVGGERFGEFLLRQVV